MRVVLDTNVIVSGLNFPGNERLVLELALRGRFELCTCLHSSSRRWPGCLDASSIGRRNARLRL